MAVQERREATLTHIQTAVMEMIMFPLSISRCGVSTLTAGSAFIVDTSPLHMYRFRLQMQRQKVLDANSAQQGCVWIPAELNSWLPSTGTTDN